MQKALSSDGLLIVVELGSEWPAAPAASCASARKVLAQVEGESPAAFAVRVGEYVDGLQSGRWALGTAWIACNERIDDSARSARAELARALASALARGGGGEVQLFASDRNSGRSRSVFRTLSSELSREWRRGKVYVKLRFADEAAEDVGSGEPFAKKVVRSSRAKPGVRRVA